MIETQEVLDSRDVIARREELQGERDDLSEALDDLGIRISEHNAAWEQTPGATWKAEYERLKAEQAAAKEALKAWDAENAEELASLVDFCEEFEGYGDWNYGATLIREDHFVKYIEDLIHAAYELPKEFTSGQWPYRHMKIDYEAAADEARADYAEADLLGQTYLIST